MDPRTDEWELIVRLVQNYALRKYGEIAAGFTLHLPRAGDHREPFPARSANGGVGLVPCYARDPPEFRGDETVNSKWASGAEAKRLSDFGKVYQPGIGVFTFNGDMQRGIVRQLWEAREADLPGVNQAELLRVVRSGSTRLADLFAHCPAWGKLIVKVEGSPGVYCLAELPDTEEIETDDSKGGDEYTP